VSGEKSPQIKFPPIPLIRYIKAIRTVLKPKQENNDQGTGRWQHQTKKRLNNSLITILTMLPRDFWILNIKRSALASSYAGSFLRLNNNLEI